MQRLHAFLEAESGATAIEYGLIVAFVSLAGILAFELMGSNISNFFSSVSSTIDAAQPGA